MGPLKQYEIKLQYTVFNSSHDVFQRFTFSITVYLGITKYQNKYVKLSSTNDITKDEINLTTFSVLAL